MESLNAPRAAVAAVVLVVAALAAFLVLVVQPASAATTTPPSSPGVTEVDTGHDFGGLEDEDQVEDEDAPDADLHCCRRGGMF
jgi:hypothetical protein